MRCATGFSSCSSTTNGPWTNVVVIALVAYILAARVVGNKRQEQRTLMVVNDCVIIFSILDIVHRQGLHAMWWWLATQQVAMLAAPNWLLQPVLGGTAIERHNNQTLSRL
jgi:hypothetical protein